MTKVGWSIRTAVALPPLWELREDEDFLYLHDPSEVVAVLGKHTTAEAIEALVAILKDRREARKC